MRVVVLRSSRYLPMALRRSAERWPGAEFAVVVQPGSRDDGGVPVRRFEFGAHRFSPWAWRRSAARAAVRFWRPTEVVVQLPVAGTHGSIRLGLVALSIAPHGFWYVLPTGELQFMSRRRWWAGLGFRAVRGGFVVSAVLAVAVAAILAWPSYRWSLARTARGDA